MDPATGQPRDTWGSKAAFILAAAGSAIGLGNIWGFPTVAGQNGGAAFLLIYLVAVAFIGAPVMLAELIVGPEDRKEPGRRVQGARPANRLGVRRRPRRVHRARDSELLLGDRRLDTVVHVQDRDRHLRPGRRHRGDLRGGRRKPRVRRSAGTALSWRSRSTSCSAACGMESSAGPRC